MTTLGNNDFSSKRKKTNLQTYLYKKLAPGKKSEPKLAPMIRPAPMVNGPVICR